MFYMSETIKTLKDGEDIEVLTIISILAQIVNVELKENIIEKILKELGVKCSLEVIIQFLNVKNEKTKEFKELVDSRNDLVQTHSVKQHNTPEIESTSGETKEVSKKEEKVQEDEEEDFF
jgi:hypothetical protein